MNSQRTVSASKNNNTQLTAQLLSVTSDHWVDFYVLGAYWMRRTLCVVIFGRTRCVQTVHLIIFCLRYFMVKKTAKLGREID